jgi:DNA-binding CsgD family transcriptional regulator
MSGGEELLQQNVKLLMLRERELLSLWRKQHRFEAWLSLAQSLALLVESASDRNRVLRRVSEAFKSKLSFQQVAFFEAAGRSLVSIGLDPDVECLAAPLSERAAKAVFAAKNGQSPDSDGDEVAQGARCFHRFLWHWVEAVDPPMLLVAGYDRERAEFYPPFNETDFAQFTMVGGELDLLLGNVAKIRQCARGEEQLTGRELEVSRLLARGKTNKEIGALLGISSRTVQTHVANIFDKLGVRNRAGAATWVVEHHVTV